MLNPDRLSWEPLRGWCTVSARTNGPGALALGCAALSGLVLTTPEQAVVTFLVGGAGSSAVMVLTVPLLADLVPRHHTGVATGALAAAGSIAAPISAVAAGGLSDLFGPRAIFALMAAMIAVALALLPFTRPSTGSVGERTGPPGPCPDKPRREHPDVHASL
jgi:MFS family permease